jgi:hypothetical protein
VKRIDGELRHLLTTLTKLRPAALRNTLADMAPGYSTGNDEPPVKTSDTSDPTGDAATRRNRPGDAWHRYTQALHRAAVAIDDMWRIEQFWNNQPDTPPPTIDNTPGCAVIERVATARQLAGAWEPVHRTGTVGGRLEHPLPLGRWAYDFVCDHDRLPTTDETVQHIHGHNVKIKT